MKSYLDVSAFVLAGGASTRMGRDKALLELNGVPIIVRMAKLVEPYVASVTIVGAPQRYARLGLKVISDLWPGTGPLGGITTALSGSSSNWNLIIACDLPYLTEEWIEWMLGRTAESRAQAIVPESSRGLEPLAALYRKDCVGAFSTALERGVRRVSEAIQGLIFERVSAGQWHGMEPIDALFRNVNTPEDFSEAQRRIGSTSTNAG